MCYRLNCCMVNLGPRSVHPSEERKWCIHNGATLRLLAQEVDKSVEQVCQILYQMTLQQFGRLLNTKMSGWQLCRVPLVQPDTCEMYYGIYDEEGNLRKNMNSRLWNILRLILENFKEDLKQQEEELKQEQTYLKRRGGQVPLRLGLETGLNRMVLKNSMEQKKEKKLKQVQAYMKRRGSHLGANWLDFKNESRKSLGLVTPNNSLQESTKFQKDLAEKLLNEANKANQRPDLSLKEDQESPDYLEKDVKSSARTSVNTPKLISTLPSTPPEAKDRSSKSFTNHISATAKPKLKARASGISQKDIKNISFLYGKVVQSRQTVPRLLSITKPTLPPVIPPSGRKRRANRRIFGEPIPVLMHEPFDKTKPWTWIRRHPKQTRLLYTGDLGQSKVHRYKRESVQAAFNKFKLTQQYSLHSSYSTASVKKLKKTNIFGNPAKPSTVKTVKYPKLGSQSFTVVGLKRQL